MEEAKVLEFEREEFDGEGFENEEMAYGKEQTKHMLIGFAAGAGTAGTAGVALWFTERKKRLSLLKQLKNTNIVLNGIINGEEKVMIGKHEIILDEIEMDEAGYVTGYAVKEIQNNLEKVWIRKKEKQEWLETLENLLTQTVVYEQNKLYKNLNEIANDEDVEILDEE